MNINNKKPLLMLLFLAVCASLSSFTTRFGGEGYRISVNGTVVLEAFGEGMNKVRTLQLDQYPAGSELTVRYFHCGKIGKSRVITIKDDKNAVVKQWKYKDVNDLNADMSCGVKDLVSLQKGEGNLYLYYASTELKNERLLVAIHSGATAKAVRK